MVGSAAQTRPNRLLLQAINLNPAVDLEAATGFAAPYNRSERLEPVRRVELAALQVSFQGFAQDAIPPLHRIQLLRSFSQPRQETGDPEVGAACLVLVAMRAAECQRYLPGVLGLSGDRLHQQRTAGNRLGPVIGVSQTDEQAAPIEDQRDAASEEPGTR